MIRSVQAAYLKLIDKLHIVYLVYAIPMAILVAFITPAFQNPDEINHFARAEQVSRLEFLPVFTFDKDQSRPKTDSIPNDENVFYPDKGGFKVDKGVIESADVIVPVMGNNNVKVTPEMAARIKTFKWGSGYTYANFGNTAIYPPVVYIMPALGICVGKVLGMSVVSTLTLSRLLNAALTILLGFFALKLAKRSNLLLFIALLFPMTIAMDVSVSQDAVLIACAFLLTGIIDCVEFDEQGKYTPWQIAIMILLTTVIAIGKPPYVLFVFLLLFLKLKPQVKVAGIAITLLVLFGWIHFNSAAFGIHFAPAQLRVNGKLQVQHIIHDPLHFISLFFKESSGSISIILRMVVGVLGWLDLTFPFFYYNLVYCVFLLGLIVSFKRDNWNNIRLRIVLLICVIGTFVAVVTAQYVTWTPLDWPTLNGMQGRYLLPIYPFLALALSTSVKNTRWLNIRSVLFIVVILFPLYSGIIVTHHLNKRYYPAAHKQ